MVKSAKSKSTPKKQSKAAFVRSLPATTPAKEVVAKAKALGMQLSEPYVYNVRATSKVSARKHPGARHTNGAHSLGGRSAEDLLRAVAAELGLARAIGVLQAEHDRVHRLLGGS
jgi:hypothetical protein